MPIERISSIKNHRIFNDFTWPDDLGNFASKNLIYGWNGTGKSTLSNLFRAVEKKETIDEGQVEFLINGYKVKGSHLDTTKDLPPVRVFNKNFVDENVFNNEDKVNPIFYLGADNVEKKKRVDGLNHRKNNLMVKWTSNCEQKRSLDKNFEEFLTDNAKKIKDLFNTAGGNHPYRNYNRGTFQEKCTNLLGLTGEELAQKILSDEEDKIEKANISAKQKETLPTPHFSWPDIEKLEEKIASALNRTVVSAVIEVLKENQDRANWVEIGLALHNRFESSDCIFCNQQLPSDRIRELEAHFNDEYNAFLNEINSLITMVETMSLALNSQSWPSAHALYDNLKERYAIKYQKVEDEDKRLRGHLKTLIEALHKKRGQPFEILPRNFDTIDLDSDCVEEVKAIIDEHNQLTAGFELSIRNSWIRIEESLVAQECSAYKTKMQEIRDLDEEINQNNSTIKEINIEIEGLLRLIEEHRTPAHELNTDICAYLGRDELQFEVNGAGYQIRRDGKLAKNLSEGERTAIAFLYFLKTLSDKDFDLCNGVVVIDDPISSLDTNSLYNAFAFMQYCTRDAGQLFILTHSHTFFRQVKNWFDFFNGRNSPPESHKAKHFMIRSRKEQGKRCSHISTMHDLLRTHESEYQYLFSLVHKAALSTADTDIHEHYYLPNVSRRLLEAFLAFRHPHTCDNLTNTIRNLEFDKVKQSRIIRFVHTHSHAWRISDPEHDASPLLEAPQVMSDIIELMRHEDQLHVENLEKIVCRTRPN